MPKCLYCGNEFETLKEDETRILFCRKQCRRNYTRDIIDKIHKLNDLQLHKLYEHILKKGFLNILIDELEDVEE